MGNPLIVGVIVGLVAGIWFNTLVGMSGLDKQTKETNRILMLILIKLKENDGRE